MLTRPHRPQLGSLELVTPATVNAVTVDELKAHARLDDPAEGDAYLEALIAAATDAVRQFTGRALLTETWKLTLDGWPGGPAEEEWDGMREGTLAMLQGGSVEIPKAPFGDVTTVETVNEDGSTTTVASSNYYVSRQAGIGRLSLRLGCVWPQVVPPVRATGGIRITFTAGYGDDASDVPAPIRHAIKMLAADYYENREAVGESGRKAAQEPPLGVSTLLRPYRVIR